MRIGAKKRPFYRVVAVDERKKRTGGYLELLGTYNPLTQPKEIKLKQDRIDDWLKKGAQSSEGFLRIIGKAPQRPRRAPKKQKKEAPTQAPTTPVEPEKSAETIKEGGEDIVASADSSLKSEPIKEGGKGAKADEEKPEEVGKRESADNEDRGGLEGEVTPESSK